MAYVKKVWKQGDDITVDALNNMETQYDEGVAYTDGKVATHDHGANGGATISYNDLKDRPSLGTVASKNVGTTEGTIPILGPNGKLADSVIPALAINEAQVVDSESAMLSLQAQRGDIAIRSDINKAFVLGGTGNPSVLSDWLELLTPTDHVLSVAGKTGAVTLTKADVGLDKVDNLSRSDILDSPALTGTPTAPSPPKADNSTRIATTNHVKQVVADYAPLDSPSFTGDIAVTGTVDGVDLSERAPIWDAKQDAIDQGLNTYDIPTFRNVNLGSTSSLEWDKVADTYTASSDVVSLVDKAMEWDGKETPSGAQSKVDAHASRFDNPHGVTKSQVGLSNVDNIKQASKAEFDAHSTDNVRHITSAERAAWNAKSEFSGNLSDLVPDADKDMGGKALNNVKINASNIIQDASHRFVTDSEKSSWNAKWDYDEDTIKSVKVNKAKDADTVSGFTVAKSVPSNAKFSDTTYSEITTAEIDAGTASTLRTMTGRRAKYILDKAQSFVDTHEAKTSNPHGVTKAQVGLGNVDNIKQATKAEFNAHDADDIRHITASERTAWNAKQDALSGNVTGHYHSSDRNRSNHTGTQPASTITGLAAVATSGKASDITQDASHRFVTDTEKSAWNSKADGSIFTPAKASEWDRISTHTHDGTAVGGPKISYNDLVDKPTIPTKLSQLATDYNNQRVSAAEKAEWDGKARPPVPFKKAISINLGHPSGYIDVLDIIPSGRTGLTVEQLQFRLIANIVEGTGPLVKICLIYDDNTVSGGIDLISKNGNTDWHPPTYYALTGPFTQKYVKGIRIERTPEEGANITGSIDIIGQIY